MKNWLCSLGGNWWRFPRSHQQVVCKVQFLTTRGWDAHQESGSCEISRGQKLRWRPFGSGAHWYKENNWNLRGKRGFCIVLGVGMSRIHTPFSWRIPHWVWHGWDGPQPPAHTAQHTTQAGLTSWCSHHFLHLDLPMQRLRNNQAHSQSLRWGLQWLWCPGLVSLPRTINF